MKLDTSSPNTAGTYRVLANVMESDWSLHFVEPDGQTRVGPWLLLDTHDEVRQILHWGNASEAELVEHETNIRRWGTSTVVLQLSGRQLDQLVDRGNGWPWNGYELRQMKLAGKYPRKPLPNVSSGKQPQK
jgi:hypothetical protein